MSFVDLGSDKATVDYLQKSLTGDNSFEKRNLVIAGDSQTLDRIEQMLAYMMWLGNIGHSTSFKVGVDGDGGFSVRITRDSKEITKIHKELLEAKLDENNDISSFDFE